MNNKIISSLKNQIQFTYDNKIGQKFKCPEFILISSALANTQNDILPEANITYGFKISRKRNYAKEKQNQRRAFVVIPHRAILELNFAELEQKFNFAINYIIKREKADN